MTAPADFDDDMPEEIDFSGGTRGKFHRPGAALRVPIYLDATVQAWLLDRARTQGVSMSALANALLRRNRDQERSVTQAAGALAEDSFRKIWNNADDADYDRLWGSPPPSAK
jgi:hypothetical protein